MFKGFETIKDIPKMSSSVLDPKPFPGRYPTRLAYVIALPGKKQEQYIGKPSVGVWQRLLAIGRQDMTAKGCFWEFDQGGLVRRAGFGPGAGVFNGWQTDRNGLVVGLHHKQVGALLGYYYPQGDTFVKFGPVEVQNWRTEPGMKKTVRVYAAGATPRTTRDSWRDWLSRVRNRKTGEQDVQLLNARESAKGASFLDYLDNVYSNPGPLDNDPL